MDGTFYDTGQQIAMTTMKENVRHAVETVYQYVAIKVSAILTQGSRSASPIVLSLREREQSGGGDQTCFCAETSCGQQKPRELSERTDEC